MESMLKILKRKSQKLFHAAIEIFEPSIDQLPNAECSLKHLAPCFELCYVKEVNLSLEVFHLLVLLRIC